MQPVVKTAPPKPKTCRSKQLQRCVEHYLDLYTTQKTVIDAALEALHGLPVMEELDTPLIMEELS